MQSGRSQCLKTTNVGKTRRLPVMIKQAETDRDSVVSCSKAHQMVLLICVKPSSLYPRLTGAHQMCVVQCCLQIEEITFGESNLSHPQPALEQVSLSSIAGSQRKPHLFNSNDEDQLLVQATQQAKRWVNTVCVTPCM